MSDRTPPLLPPRRSNWKKGALQVGLFIRTEEGTVMESVSDDSKDAHRDAAYALLHVSLCNGCKDCCAARKANRTIVVAIEKRQAGSK